MNIAKYYIVAATRLEINNIIEFCNVTFDKIGDLLFSINEHTHLQLLIHGVGVPATIFNLCQLEASSIASIMQVGISGSFNKELGIGNVYLVGSDRFADIGIQNNNTFIDAYEMELINANELPYSNGWLLNLQHPVPFFFHGLSTVKSITVNTVSGSEEVISALQKKYSPTLESMEGAALHYVCLQKNIPFVQIRAISNYVQVRNKSKWDIPLAVKNANETMIDFLKTL